MTTTGPSSTRFGTQTLSSPPPPGTQNVTGIAPADMGVELRLGRLGRENAQTKARRLLVEGRVCIRRVDDQGVLATVRGDSGCLRTVTYEGDLWLCDCPARRSCSHVLAVQQVVVVG